MQNTPDTSKFTNQTLEQLRESQEKLNQRKAAPISEIPAAYAAKLNEDEKDDTPERIISRALHLIDRPQKALPQFMEYDTAKKIIWKIGNGILAQAGKKWIVDDVQKNVIEGLVKYFINDPDCRFDLSKGIYLFGDVGRGKTFIFKIMEVFCIASKNTLRRFKIGNCADISDRVLWSKENMQEVMAGYCKGTWLFDDLGNEPSAIKNYGNDIQVMERILMQRYSKFVNGACITHITTNDTPDEFEKKYGTRLSDRAQEVFNFVMLKGESKRMSTISTKI